MMLGIGGVAIGGGALWYGMRSRRATPKDTTPTQPAAISTAVPEPAIEVSAAAPETAVLAPAADYVYVINGFYMAMRDKYTKPPAQIHYFTTEWESAGLPWAEFRGAILGATDPATAAPGSLRRHLWDNWQILGLTTPPNVGDNGVHASASPFEALAERLNWVGADLQTDPFAQAMLAAGVPETNIVEWTKDPQVEIDGKKQSLFDSMEDLDSATVLAKAAEICGTTPAVPSEYSRNEAFVFVKPHAVTDEVVDLVKERLASCGVSVLSEGRLDAQTILDRLLIDNHYYAIANKASLTKPENLNPPEAGKQKFEQAFGESWEAALAAGKVFNAVDACTRLNVDGSGLDARWAKAKEKGDLVKFGGGFYAGKVEADGSSSSPPPSES